MTAQPATQAIEGRGEGRRGVLLALALGVALAGVVAMGGVAQQAEAAYPGPNGKIVFVSNRDGNAEIYSMDPDGTDQTNLTTNQVQDFDPAVSPDGERIAFASDRDGGDQEIYVMNADGSNQSRLTNSPGADFDPTWSPDGMRIVFESSRDGNYEIYAMDAIDREGDGNGDGQTNLTNNPARDSYPAFSPDGTSIAFTSYRDADTEIYAMDPDGTDQTNVTNNSTQDFQPAFSPDGKKIAFDSFRDGNMDVYTINAQDGSSEKRLTRNAAFDGEPAFSPDGKKIAFTSDRSGDDEVYVMNAATGSKQVNLTNSNVRNDFTPDWGVAAP